MFRTFAVEHAQIHYWLGVKKQFGLNIDQGSVPMDLKGNIWVL